MIIYVVYEKSIIVFGLLLSAKCRLQHFGLSMQRLISTLRRSLNGETKEKFSDSVVSREDVEQRAHGSMESNEHMDVDSKDGFYEVLTSIFPSLSPPMRSNSQEILSTSSEMDNLAERSSSNDNLDDFLSASEEGKGHVNESWRKSTKKTQSSSMNSVAVQCDPIMKVTQGVQWEPVLMTSQSVQCNLVSQVEKGMQCDLSTSKKQNVLDEPVLMVTTGVQYESPSEEFEERQIIYSPALTLENMPSEGQKNYSPVITIENIPFEISGINCELVNSSNRQCDEQKRFSILADLSFTWPSFQKELDVASSSQSSNCVCSSSTSSPSQRSSIKDDDAPEDEHEEQLNSFSQHKPSTSGVKGRKKANGASRVRNMKTNSQRHIRSKKDNTTNMNTRRNGGTIDGKLSDKILPLEGINGKQLLNEDVNRIDCGETKSDGVWEKEANTVSEVLNSETERTSSSINPKESIDEESPEELIEQMGNNNCSMKKNTCKNDNDSPKIIGKKQQQTASQKIIHSSHPINEVSSNVAMCSQSQRTDGLNWFSSLACEICSSPDSIAEDLLEELRDDTSSCNKNLAQKVQSKDTKILDVNCSFRNIKFSTPKKKANLSTRKSVVRNLEDDLRETGGLPFTKRKKFDSDLNNSVISASSKLSAQLVPYSNSDSDSEPSVCDNFNKSNKERPKKIGNKQKLSKSTTTNDGMQRRGALVSKQPNQDHVKSNCVVIVNRLKQGESRSISPNDSEKNRHIGESTSSSSSVSNVDDASRETDIRLRSRAKVLMNKGNAFDQQNPDKHSKNGNVGVRSSEMDSNRSVSLRESVNHRPMSIWSSDEDVEDCDNGSIQSRTTNRTSASKSSYRRRAPYTKKEREAILWYIIDHKYYKLVKGRAVWERMEKQRVCSDRTWQSMKEHFIKKILPQVETFNLEPEITKRLISVRK